MKYTFFAFAVCLMLACGSSKKAIDPAAPNPAEAGFNASGSDPKAIALADEVMNAMGGRQGWDATRYLRWNFFGKRTITWDRYQDRARIDISPKSILILLNADNTGTVRKEGVVMTEPDSVAYYLQRGREILINDSYWLVMPFKLKDKGVTLKYLGPGVNEIGGECEMIEVTFDKVGLTPENKYKLYINPSSKLITQWDYFDTVNDTVPTMSTPWQDYRPLGNIFLAMSRGKTGTLMPVAVPATLPETVFTNMQEPNWDVLLAPKKPKKKKKVLPHPAKAIKG